MFRLTKTALNSQRKREIEPGSLAVKVGGKYLYPRNLIDHYLNQLSEEVRNAHGLDESIAEDLFRLPPMNTRVLTLEETSDRLGIEPTELVTQWEKNTYPGALGWRATPDADLVFAPRDLDIWIEANANQSRQDAPSPVSD